MFLDKYSKHINSLLLYQEKKHLNYPNVVWKDAVNIDTRKDLTGILKDRV